MSAKESTLTQARLKDLLHYDPGTGIFVRRSSIGRFATGTIAGTCNARGYRSICIDLNLYYEHRLAWLYMTGAFPIFDIDHIDGNGRNNRWKNIRDAATLVNCQNRRAAQKNSASRLLGVGQAGVNWRARITIEKHTIHLGCFPTKEGAYSAYLEAKRKFHSGCTI